MTKVTIVAENPATGHTFRASARNHESVGRTPGLLLMLVAQLDASAGTLIIVQNLQPDEFFRPGSKNVWKRLRRKPRK